MLARRSNSTGTKVGRPLCNKCYNATRKEWYHGVKLHAFVMLRPGKLPIPCAFQISQASLCDLWAARQVDLDCAPVSHGKLFADRAYADAAWAASLQDDRMIELVTPRKKKLRIPYFLATALTPLLTLADSLLSPFSIGSRSDRLSNPLPVSVPSLAFSCFLLVFTPFLLLIATSNLATPFHQNVFYKYLHSVMVARTFWTFQKKVSKISSPIQRLLIYFHNLSKFSQKASPSYFAKLIRKLNPKLLGKRFLSFGISERPV